MTDSRCTGALLLAGALAFPVAGAAQVLYKLTDREGRVTYTDTPPKGFMGTVTPMETDAATNVLPADRPETAKVPAAAGTVSELAEKRRQARAELEAQLRKAQAKVEEARKAKAQASEPGTEDLQAVQRMLPPLERGAPLPRSNCFEGVDPHGRRFLNCPTMVPDSSWYERQSKLDEALRQAEEELAAAEVAYRRGTD